jgi:hypothetical protein
MATCDCASFAARPRGVRHISQPHAVTKRAIWRGDDTTAINYLTRASEPSLCYKMRGHEKVLVFSVESSLLHHLFDSDFEGVDVARQWMCS